MQCFPVLVMMLCVSILWVVLCEGILGGTTVVQQQRFPDIDLYSAATLLPHCCHTLACLPAQLARHTTGQRATSVAFQLLAALILNNLVNKGAFKYYFADFV